MATVIIGVKDSDKVLLQAYTPTTLAAMAADLSQYLAEQIDGDGVISAQEWDKLHAHLLVIVDCLAAIVGEDADDMLQDAGADPEVIYDIA